MILPSIIVDMARLSSIPVDQKRLQYFIANLWNSLTLIESRDEAIAFLKELLTPTEIRMLAKRIQIAKMLLEGYKYQEIIPHVRVTPGTISQVNNQLLYGNGGYQKIIDRLIKIEFKKQGKLEGKKSIFDPGPYAGRRTTEWLLNKAAQKGMNYLKRRSVKKSIG